MNAAPPRFHSVSLACFCALGLASLPGCSVVGDEDLGKASDVTLSPMAVLVPAGKVMQSALSSSDERPASFVMLVEGDDMLPRYPAGSALVIELTDYHALRKGMTAAFRQSGGGRVAHVLVAQMPDGWATRGFNTKEDDIGLMSEANYLGTVAMAFTANSGGAK